MDEETKGWLNEQTTSIVAHRRGGDFAKGVGRHPITFSEVDNSPAGRRVVPNDSMKSSCRIRNNQIVEVDCTMADSHFTITYFDVKSGALKRSETFIDEYKQVNGVWVPASRRVVRAENGKVITRVIEFHNPRIRFSEQAAR